MTRKFNMTILTAAFLIGTAAASFAAGGGGGGAGGGPGGAGAAAGGAGGNGPARAPLQWLCTMTN
jgi:hypothetical protein